MNRDGCLIPECIHVVPAIPEKPNALWKRCLDSSGRRGNVLENEIKRFVPGLGGKTCSRIAGLYFNRLWLPSTILLTDFFFHFYFIATFKSKACSLLIYIYIYIYIMLFILELAQRPRNLEPLIIQQVYRRTFFKENLQFSKLLLEIFRDETLEDTIRYVLGRRRLTGGGTSEAQTVNTTITERPQGKDIHLILFFHFIFLTER